LQRAIRVKDLGKVEIAEKKEYVKINANGKDVPLIGVVKQPNANLVNVAEEVGSKVKELNKILPHGVILVPFIIRLILSMILSAV